MDVDREWFDKDYYSILGVSKSADAKEVSRAYRQLARELHPDANPGDSAAGERFKEVSAAYEVIGDPDKRKRYDEVRAMGPAGGAFGAGPPGGGFGGQGFGGQGYPGGADFGDIIGNLFSRSRSERSEEMGPRRGADIEAAMTLSFDAAIKGVTTTVQVTADVKCPDCSGSGSAAGTAPRACGACHGRGAVEENQGFFSLSRPCTVCGGRGRVVDNPCPTCAGSGAVHRPREINVRIPMGVRDGQRIRVKGRGAAGANGGANGDLYVRVSVDSHPVFGRDGDHLLVTLPISISEAALGSEVEVPSLDGNPVAIRVPPGTASGKRFRVRGRGVRTPKGGGDLLVTVDVDVPSELSDAQRSALEAYAAATPSPRPDSEPVA